MSINWGDLTDFQDISSGSFGIVRKADYLGTDVAVKEFLDISDQPGFDVQKYIGREVEILGSVHHPNVLQFMGICVHEKKVYLVTELITGGHLKAWIQGAKKDTSWRLRVSFATDIARALVYLHAHRIIHRDLKSENLLLTENFRLKICDFGLSREVALTIDEKNRLSFCGTDGYMAPEIILGMSFDERVDIFSYGIILCEIITMSAADKQTFQRETPFFGIDPATVKPDDPAGCPRELLEIAIACTDADPDKRPILKDVLVKLRKLETELMKEVPLNFGVLGSDQALSPEGRSPSIGSLDGSVADESVDLGNSSTHSVASVDPTFVASPASAGGSTNAATIRRIGHYVPHRFSLISRPTMAKCEVCHKRMGLSKKHLQCDDCMSVYHKRCGPQATPACGLSSELRTSLELLEPRKPLAAQR